MAEAALPPGTTLPRNRLAAVTLDAASLGTSHGDRARERQVAIADLLAANEFAVTGHGGGPYRLFLAVQDGKLAFDIRSNDGQPVMLHVLSLRPFRSLVKDYVLLCDSLLAAAHALSPAQMEAIDMGRRGLHDEGAERLAERLKGKIEADFATMRRLFTLLTVLHWRG